MKLLPKNLEGKIKYLETVDSNNRVEYTEFDKNGKLILRKVTVNEAVELVEEYKYDKFGNETLYEKYEYLPDFGMPEGLTITEVREKEYNDQNLLIFEFEGFTTSERDFGSTYYYNYVYDSSGKIIKKITQDIEKKEIVITEYSYFENGFLKSEITTSTENNEYKKMENYYDETGLLVKYHGYIDDKEENLINEYTITLRGKEEY